MLPDGHGHCQPPHGQYNVGGRVPSYGYLQIRAVVQVEVRMKAELVHR